jgi:CBS domain-containing protein
MQVRDVMSSAHVATVEPGDTLDLAAQIMLWTGARHLPVVRAGLVVGVLSERDVFRHQGQAGARAGARDPVETAMRSPPVTISPDEPLATAVALMHEKKLGCLPVVAGGALVGIITTTDLLRHQLDTALRGPPTSLPPPVRNVMKTVPAVVTPETNVYEAAALMAARRVRHLPVVDRARRVVGMLSDRDLRSALGDLSRLLATPEPPDLTHATPVSSVMSKQVVTVAASAPITTAIRLLLEHKFGTLPVAGDDGVVQGIITYIDIIAALRDRSPRK